MADPSPPPEPASPAPPRRGLVVVAIAVVGVLVLVGLVLARRSAPDDEPRALAATTGTAAPTTVASTGPTTTTTAPTTTTTEPEPVPDPLPADPYAPTPPEVLGQIEIPKLGVVGDLQQGITLTAINRGPGHWPGTPMPGGMGNMVVAGHRTTYSKPFARLDELVAGDQVIFRTPTGTSVYQVRGVIIVPAANIGIAAQNRAHTATLFACHPRGSATQRIVAKLALLGPDGQPVDPPEALPPVQAGSDPVTDTTLLVRDTGQGATPGRDPLAGD